MKIRKGFVANSSSSSFIIATKTRMNRKELETHLVAAFKVPEDSPVYRFVRNMAASLASSSNPCESKEAFCEEMGYDEHNIPDYLKKAFDDGWTVYQGSSDDQSGDIAEEALCEIGISYRTDDLIIEKGEGY